MSFRYAVFAALALGVVAALWWLLGGVLQAPPVGTLASDGAGSSAPGPREGANGAEDGASDYPADYVDELPLTDAPVLPPGLVEDYVPAFEKPDLIGDGMLVPLEIDLGDPQLPESEATSAESE